MILTRKCISYNYYATSDLYRYEFEHSILLVMIEVYLFLNDCILNDCILLLSIRLYTIVINFLGTVYTLIR